MRIFKSHPLLVCALTFIFANYPLYISSHYHNIIIMYVFYLKVLPILFLALLCLCLVNYNVKCVLETNSLIPLLSACPHGLATVALCSVCSSLGQHFSIIGQCTHKWSKLNYDQHLVKNGYCDLAGSGGVDGSGAWDSLHHVVSNMGDIAYSCSQCHALSCASCIGL